MVQCIATIYLFILFKPLQNVWQRLTIIEKAALSISKKASWNAQQK